MRFSIKARSWTDMPVKAAGLGDGERRSRGAILSQRDQTAATPPSSAATVARKAITTPYDRSIVPVQPSPSGYYAWRRRPLSRRSRDNRRHSTPASQSEVGKVSVVQRPASAPAARNRQSSFEFVNRSQLLFVTISTALCLGDHRRRPEGPAPPGAGHEGGHGQLHGLLRRSQAPCQRQAKFPQAR